MMYSAINTSQQELGQRAEDRTEHRDKSYEARQTAWCKRMPTARLLPTYLWCPAFLVYITKLEAQDFKVQRVLRAWPIAALAHGLPYCWEQMEIGLARAWNGFHTPRPAHTVPNLSRHSFPSNLAFAFPLPSHCKAKTSPHRPWKWSNYHMGNGFSQP